MTETAQRAAVVAEARSWLRCRYHVAGTVKIEVAADGTIIERGGVDCATLLAEVYRRAGLIGAVEIPHYPADWHLHRKTERYLAAVLEHAREIPEADAKPGDVVLWLFGHVYSHGAIIVEPGWPDIIHASVAARCVQLDHGLGGEWGDKPRKFFTLWPREA